MKKVKTKNNLKIKTSGITLIAMIVTIIVLLILAGISIAMIRNSNLLDKTKIAKEKYSNSQKEETATIDDYSNQIENYEIAENGRENTKINYCKIPANSITESTASEANPCVVVETYRNETEWCRVWSDGWKEQGGTSIGGSNSSGNVTNFLKDFINTDYTITTSDSISTHVNAASCALVITQKNVNNFYISSSWVADSSWNFANIKFSWYACGY